MKEVRSQCRPSPSSTHGVSCQRECISALSVHHASDEQIISWWLRTCAKLGEGRRGRGRTLLYWATVYNRRGIVHWLVRYARGRTVIDLQNEESSYTPLHSALLHGHISCALALVREGASTRVMDKEGLSPIELALHSMSYEDVNIFGPHWAYTMGENGAYSLGHSQGTPRHTAERVDSLARSHIAVDSVCMGKYHSLFVSKEGKVYACGGGQGGRLGVGKEVTVQFKPALVKLPVDAIIVCVAVGDDHSVFVDQEGRVFTCGRNSCGQLGAGKSVEGWMQPGQVDVPRVVRCAATKHFTVLIGVGAQADIYVCGENMGQFAAHSMLQLSEIGVPDLSSNKPLVLPVYVDGAVEGEEERSEVVIATAARCLCVKKHNGSMLLFAANDAIKIAAQQRDIVQLCVVEASLPTSQRSPSVARQPLRVISLRRCGRLLVWSRESKLLVCHIYPSPLHSLTPHVPMIRPIRGVCPSSVGRVLLLFDDGVVHEGELGGNFVDGGISTAAWRGGRREDAYRGGDGHIVPMTLLGRLPGVSKCVSMSVCGASRGFIMQQTHIALTQVPTIDEGSLAVDMRRLLREADEETADLRIVLDGGVETYAHLWVLLAQCPLLGALVDDHRCWRVADVSIDVLHQFLLALYSGDSAMIANARSISTFESLLPWTQCVAQFERLIELTGVQWIRAAVGDRQTSATKLIARISRRPIGRAEGEEKYDLDVALKCRDGVVIYADSCLLCLRCEYFSTMFSFLSSVSPSESTSSIDLPMEGDVALAILHFIYTDTLSEGSSNLSKSRRKRAKSQTDSAPTAEDDIPQFLCELLLAADELLLARLVQLVEQAIALRLSLPNCVPLLHFALLVPSAGQLVDACAECICKNLCAMLDTNALLELNEEAVDAVDMMYKSLNPACQSRVLGPNAYSPSVDDMEEVHKEMATLCDGSMEQLGELYARQMALLDRAPRVKPISATTTSPRPLNGSAVEEEGEWTMIKGNNRQVEGETTPIRIANPPPPLSPWSNSPSAPESPSDVRRDVSKPWGDDGLHHAVGVSMKELMLHDQHMAARDKRRAAEGRTRNQSIHRTWQEGGNPWQSIPSASPENGVTLIKEIQSAAEAEKTRDNRRRERPIHLIQAEERAMQELRFAYNVEGNFDETITVQRAGEGEEEVLDIGAPKWSAMI